MKRIIFFLCVWLGFLNLSAQTTNQKSFIGISVGPSFPVGDFANKSVSNENSGLATTGGFLNLNYGYRFSNNFGAIAILRGSIYGVDSQSLKNNYSLPDGSGGSISFDAGTWKTGAVMVGLFQGISLGTNKDFVLEARGAIGVQRTSSPSLKIKGSITGFGTFEGEQKSVSATAFAYLVGLGLNYGLGNNLSLKLHGDYSGSNPKFQDITASSYAAGTKITSKQNINTIDVGVGLALNF
ncbi:outer membrane beta-barrel protein [Pedobacter nototheniae]|uniref:outer membrane beta-barrel protein n=1 Tax=Pedobacter nototheniae TaxID=2488994 RepID=UPI00292F5B9C|nr:outer membrane beta-barrel protein [Pedobacter nototheniae]